MNASKLLNQPELIEEFRTLAANVFTFVSSWNDVDPNAMRLYARKRPAREAVERYQQQMEHQIDPIQLRSRVADDFQVPRGSNADSVPATQRTTNSLDAKVKEPQKLLIFKGCIYEFTFNSSARNNTFSHSQICILIDLPTQDNLNEFKPFEVVAAPKGLDDVIYNPAKTKDEYLAEGWCVRKVVTAPENIQHIGSELHATRRQYGIKHHVTCTIHSSMGDTLHKVAMEVSATEEKFKLWGKISSCCWY